MKIGQKVEIKDNLWGRTIKGIITDIAICYFKVTDEKGTSTYHWNDDIELKEI